VYIQVEGFSNMSKIKIRNLSMGSDVFPEGSRVRVVSYSPFRGLKGTIRTVHHIPPLEELFCFYQIELEGAQVKEPVWFNYEEVELLAPQ
jgi:hypothetical protein